MTSTISTHATQALNRLLEQFKDKDNFKNLISSYCTEVQTLENELYNLFIMTLENAEGVQLDNVYGKIVGILRAASESDDDYRLRIRARMLTLRSSGTPEQLLEIATLMSDVGYELIEYDYAAYEIVAQDTLTQGQLIADELTEARSAGVNGKLRWTQHTLDNTFRFNQTPLRRTVGIDKELKCIADDGTTFVAAGDDVIVKSTDGITWSVVRNDATENWNSIVWDADHSLFIAAGSGGKIITSPDATTWTNRTSGISNTIYDVKTSAGTTICVYYGVGGGGKHIIRSTDGTSWSLVEGNATNGLTTIATDRSGNWVASGGTPPEIVKSVDDGLTWELVSSHGLTSGFIEDRCLMYADSKWIAGHKISDSYIKYSTDLVTWNIAYTAVSGEDEAYFERLRYFNSRFFVPCSYNVIVYSDDFENWYLIKTLNDDLKDITYRASIPRYVICGGNASGDAMLLTQDYNPSGKGFGGFTGVAPQDIFEGYWSEVG